eukprot:TRINITY_DN18073_c0_g2_i1.p1 TRINITY_DN18073_c0_g2~~TRINITY_DN18073_c0_g2_i1.p1  ORF type:complete len:968 (-),score=186.16 TRINITY_DN18073_c0_g2_i1:178-3081(-)
MADGVVVGVRLRPFNAREIDLNSELCIDMQGQMTIIKDPLLPESEFGSKKFTFDQSFWSHDGFVKDDTGYLRPDGPGSRYADQRVVFDCFGQRVLSNAWSGYHCCLFAYGQTGAGKSYSMVGYGPNKGIIPVACEEIFDRIGRSEDPTMSYEVVLSMFEIYNETVQDLFVAWEERPKNGLQVRESKALGVYVEGAQKRAVDSYAEIEQLIEEAIENRTVGSTMMNAVSSRAHTVTTIEFKRVERLSSGPPLVRLSMINLVDLAGSEKLGQTGATGDRAKEGMMINKSLSALGNVIERLAERSMNIARRAPKPEIVIPYRDSKLTRILQNALGGSSKTIMICAISPASINYEETLSTLRYSDRAKKIKNNAVVNENPQDRILRELKEENQKLKEMLETVSVGCVDVQAISQQQLEVQRLEDALKDIQRSHAEKLEQSKAITRNSRQRRNVTDGGPFIFNLNRDVQLSGRLKFYFPAGCTSRIGGRTERSASDDESSSCATPVAEQDGDGDSDEEVLRENHIVILGDGMLAKHAMVRNDGRTCWLSCPPAARDSLWVNGVRFDEIMKVLSEKQENSSMQRMFDRIYSQGRETDTDVGTSVVPNGGFRRSVTEKESNAGVSVTRKSALFRSESDDDDDDDDAIAKPVLQRSFGPRGHQWGLPLEQLDRVAFACNFFVFVSGKRSMHDMLVTSGQLSYKIAAQEMPASWSRVCKRALAVDDASSDGSRCDRRHPCGDNRSEHGGGGSSSIRQLHHRHRSASNISSPSDAASGAETEYSRDLRQGQYVCCICHGRVMSMRSLTGLPGEEALKVQLEARDRQLAAKDEEIRKLRAQLLVSKSTREWVKMTKASAEAAERALETDKTFEHDGVDEFDGDYASHEHGQLNAWGHKSVLANKVRVLSEALASGYDNVGADLNVALPLLSSSTRKAFGQAAKKTPPMKPTVLSATRDEREGSHSDIVNQDSTVCKTE